MRHLGVMWLSWLPAWFVWLHIMLVEVAWCLSWCLRDDLCVLWLGSRWEALWYLKYVISVTEQVRDILMHKICFRPLVRPVPFLPLQLWRNLHTFSHYMTAVCCLEMDCNFQWRWMIDFEKAMSITLRRQCQSSSQNKWYVVSSIGEAESYFKLAASEWKYLMSKTISSIANNCFCFVGGGGGGCIKLIIFFLAYCSKQILGILRSGDNLYGLWLQNGWEIPWCMRCATLPCG